MMQNDRLAQKGLRILGFAYRCWEMLPHEQDNPQGDPESQLIWLGLVGMIDAPRPEVSEAVQRCRQAGIRPVMITGDHWLTAKAIAQQLGIAQSGDRILTGKELEPMTDGELETEVVASSVYARVSPEHKLRIVKALQRQGRIVAMTGDGVNDAPALKQANIGIAMGITGTDVSKEASDMVLLDDNFTSIVAATEEGRVVYDNIRRFVKYILGSNIGEVLTIACAPLVFARSDVVGKCRLGTVNPPANSVDEPGHRWFARAGIGSGTGYPRDDGAAPPPPRREYFCTGVGLIYSAHRHCVCHNDGVADALGLRPCKRSR